MPAEAAKAMPKAVTGTAAMQLVEKGEIGLEQPPLRLCRSRAAAARKSSQYGCRDRTMVPPTGTGSELRRFAICNGQVDFEFGHTIFRVSVGHATGLAVFAAAAGAIELSHSAAR